MKTQQSKKSDAFRSVKIPAEPRWKIGVICALLAALVLLVFGKTVRYDFAYDDFMYVTENPIVQKGLTFGGVLWSFTFGEVGHWHPLTWMSHMLDCELYGVRPGGPHLTNVFLHGAATVLLFLALREMTGALWRSAFAAAAWAVHPLRVESVAWISERKDVLSGVFFMLALGAYLSHARQPSAWRMAAVSVFLALGLMSKDMLVTFPCVLLLLDYWPLGRLTERTQFVQLLKEKIPLFVLSALSCLITFLVPEQVTAPNHLPFWLRLENALISYCTYLRQSVWSTGLSANYPNPIHAFPFWEVAGSLVLLCLISVAAFGLRKGHPYVLVGWLWFLGMLAPVIGLAQISHYAHADRYTYLPQIGLWIAGAWGAADFAGNLPARQRLLAASAGIILCALACAAWKQERYWRDNISLWSHALEINRSDFVAQANLGYVLLLQGHPDDALKHLRESVRINPNFEVPHRNIGVALEQEGKEKEAIAEYREALRLNPNYMDAHCKLGLALERQGQLAGAVAEYREAVRISPHYPEAHRSLGAALAKEGRLEDAIAEYNEVLKAQPHSAEIQNELGNMQLQLGRTGEAIQNFCNALQEYPGYAEAHNNLGNALVAQKRLDEAIAEYREALRIEPGYANTHYNLGNALFREGQGAEAIGQLQKALDLQPDNAIYQNDLALMLSMAPQTSLRDGARALDLAAKANQSTGGKNPMILRTLAAAYAETGDFPHATETARKAIELIESQNNHPPVDELRRDLQLYEANHRYESSR